MTKSPNHKTVLRMRFAELHGITETQLLRLLRTADYVYKYGVKYSNGGDDYLPAYEFAQSRFLANIKECGFDDYEMNGLYPTLRKNGQDIWLPE